MTVASCRLRPVARIMFFEKLLAEQHSARTVQPATTPALPTFMYQIHARPIHLHHIPSAPNRVHLGRIRATRPRTPFFSSGRFESSAHGDLSGAKVSLARHFQTHALFDHDQILFEHVRRRPQGRESACSGAGAAAVGGGRIGEVLLRASNTCVVLRHDSQCCETIPSNEW